MDAEASPEEGVVAIGGGGPQGRIVEQQALDLLHEVGMSDLLGGRRRPEGRLLLVRHPSRLGVYPAQLQHLVEHGSPAGQGGLAVVIGIGGRWGLDQPGQEGRFAQAEVGHLLPEVAGGRGADPVGAVPEVDGVEIALQDLLLAEALLQPHRQGGLGELAVYRDLRSEQDVLEVLLGDGRSALHHVLGLQIGHQRPGQRAQVDPGMGPIALVLDGHHRIDQVTGKLVVGDEHTVLLGVPLGQHAPIARIDDGGQPEVAQAGILQRLDGAGRHDQHPSRPASHRPDGTGRGPGN